MDSIEPPDPMWGDVPDARDLDGFEPDGRTIEEQAAAYRDGITGDTLGRLGVRRLDRVPSDPPPPMLFDRLDPSGHTILFGDGDTGKGVLASWWITRLVEHGHRVLLIDYEDHPQEWSSRVRSLGGQARESVHHVSPMSRSWTGQRGPIWAQADELITAIDAIGATYVVIDSIVPACFGSDPLKPETAAMYTDGLVHLGLPVLSLAHATKAGELKYPFGSVFWHNLSRATWSARKLGGEGHRVLLSHRKHNTSSGIGRLLATITWHEDVPGEVDEQPWSVKLAEAILDVLGDERLSVTEIVARMNEDIDEEEDEPVKADSVRKALRRGMLDNPRRFTVEGTGGSAGWRRA